MPPWTLKRLERAVETFSAQLQCAICLCAYDNPVSLPCNHCFCEECIHRALELKTLCPICKAPAKKRRLRYDTTMLCAAPEDAAAEKQPQSIEMKTTKQTTEKQVTTAPSDVKIAAAKPVKVAATTPERRSPPRRRAQTKNSPGSQTQTLMDAWITGGSTSLRPQLVKMKTEKQTTPVRRASPRRRDLYSEMASPMSPALFEISAPRAAKTQVAEAIAGSSAERLHCEDTMTQIDNVDEQRWSGADAAGADETQLEAKALSPQRVPGAFIRRPAEDIASDSTPSHSARKRQRRRPSEIMASPNAGAPKTRPSPHSENKIDEWAELLGAEVVQYWSNHVTHLIVKCVSAEEVKDEERSMDESDSKSPPQARKDGKRKLFSDPKPGRWVKIRSLKYLKALVAGRWIVSDEWLQDHGGYVDRSNVGTMLFADFCFHLIGEFLPPMPPVTELNSLICMGGGKLIPFMDDIPDEMHKRENRTRKLIIVSDKLNPNALRQQTRHLKAKSQVKAVSAAIIVNYLWVINSISEAKLRELP
uniref:RING-type domain-containing protein n=1 Tax=Phytophthora ramorum TaxID=164328 RepID=H3HCZ7_PHYRM